MDACINGDENKWKNKDVLKFAQDLIGVDGLVEALQVATEDMDDDVRLVAALVFLTRAARKLRHDDREHLYKNISANLRVAVDLRP